MTTAQPDNFQKLLTLKEASDKLHVSIETLLSWNQNNILKPIITQNGEICYTNPQLEEFIRIRQLVQKTASQSQPFQHTSSHFTDMPLEQKPHTQTHIKRVSFRPVISLVAIVAVVSLVAFSQTGNNQSLLAKNDQSKTANAPLGTQTSKLSLSNQVAFRGNFDSDQSVFKEKIATRSIALKNNSPKITAIVASVAGSKTIAREKPNIRVAVGHIDTNDYASTVAFADVPLDENSAIDENGNIKGETKITTLAAVLGGGDGIDSFKQAYLQDNQNRSNSTEQWIFMLMGMATLFILMQRRVRPAKLPAQTEPVAQKVLEINQKTDGTVMLNFMGKDYKISKPELYSESDRFIERLMELVKSGIKEFEYESLTDERLSLTTPLSRLVTRLGFVGMKRDLFFPRTSKDRVYFRKYLTMKDLEDMRLTTEEVSDGLEFASQNP